MRRFHDGFLLVGHVGGIAVRAHWATPIGALLLGGFQVRPRAWALFAVLILLHELAHAAVARRLRLPVFSVDLMPFGGQCVTGQPRTRTHRALIAAAGPLLHVVLCFFALALLRLGPGAFPPAVRQLVDLSAQANFGLAALNLVPIRPLDGADAWKLVGIGITSGWNRLASAIERLALAWKDWRLERRARRLGLRLAPLDRTEADDRDAGAPRKWMN